MAAIAIAVSLKTIHFQRGGSSPPVPAGNGLMWGLNNFLLWSTGNYLIWGT